MIKPKMLKNILKVKYKKVGVENERKIYYKSFIKMCSRLLLSNKNLEHILIKLL